jgi:hypothetical protein
MRRILIRNFLLLELVLSTAIFSFAGAALLAPFQLHFKTLQSQERQLQVKRLSSLANIQLHCPEYLYKYVSSWNESSQKNLKQHSISWHWDSRLKEDRFNHLKWKLRLRCLSQTPKRERQGYPAWRRFLEANWQANWPDGDKSHAAHYFSVLRSKPADV